jgi:hypothetical protein
MMVMDLDVGPDSAGDGPPEVSLVLIAEGKATRYNPGVMDRVVANRLLWRHITREQVKAAAGFVAVADKRHLGRMVYIEWPDGRKTGPYLVVDCGRARDQEHLRKIGFAVDLSYELAEQFLEDINMPRQGVRVWLLDSENGA